jgi:hypothetical protein
MGGSTLSTFAIDKRDQKWSPTNAVAGRMSPRPDVISISFLNTGRDDNNGIILNKIIPWD